MIGTVLAVIVVFAILYIGTRSAGYYRNYSVADSDVTTSGAMAPAAIGIGAGLVMLLLMALLCFGITRWDWLGHPAVSHVAVARPKAIETPGAATGVGASPSSASPSPPPSP